MKNDQETYIAVTCLSSVQDTTDRRQTISQTCHFLDGTMQVMEKHVLTKLVSYGRQGQKQVIGYAPVTNRGDGVNIERPLGKHKVVKYFERDEVEMDGTGQKEIEVSMPFNVEIDDQTGRIRQKYICRPRCKCKDLTG